MHIAVFGASIAYGSWDLEKGGWVNRLRLHLDHDSHYHLIYNFGVPGNNSADLIKRIGAQAATVEPDIIIVSVGINDSALLDDKTNHVDALTYQSNVRVILRTAKEHAKRVIFLGLTPVDERQTAPVGWDDHVYYRNKEIIRYNEAAQKACEAESAEFMDVYEKLLASEVYRKSLGDGLHPDAVGHQLIFEAVLSALAL
jgi:lysophospholipase L1-like esterase